MAHQITEEKIIGYREHLKQEEYAESTVQKYLRDIRGFAAWLAGPTAFGRREGVAADANESGGGETANASGSGGNVNGGECRESGDSGLEEKGAESAGNPVRDSGCQVDRQAAAGWKAHLVAQGYAPVTINAMLSSLNGFFAFLGWEGYRVKFLKIQRRAFCSQDRELSRGEYVRLLEAARERGKMRIALLLEAICASGIRVSEVKYITVEALRRRRADVSLKGKVRTIFLPGKLCKKLEDYARRQGIRTGELFVTRSGKSISRCQIWREMKSLCRGAGVRASKVFPHNLRHLFARTFYKASRDIVKLADVLGHSSIETTRIYLISTGEMHARRMEQLGLVS